MASTNNANEAKRKLLESSQKWLDIKNIKDNETSKFRSIRYVCCDKIYLIYMFLMFLIYLKSRLC